MLFGIHLNALGMTDPPSEQEASALASLLGRKAAEAAMLQHHCRLVSCGDMVTVLSEVPAVPPHQYRSGMR